MKNKTRIGTVHLLRTRRFVRSAGVPTVFFLAVPFLASCGGGGSAAVNPPPPPPAVAVTISPLAVTLPAEGSQTFTATVTGSSNVAVNWSVQDGAAFGSITGNGVYTAPNSPGLVCHVIATSQADSTKSAMATITISTVSMFVLPFEVNLAVGQMQTFTATVQGTTNTAVSWTVQEGAAGGSITGAGVYTAPQSLGTFHVIATSQADSRISATVKVNVVPIAVTISPQVDILGPAGVRAFTATVTISDQTVTWTIQEGAAGGTITSTGIYTAPTQLGIYHVIATSVADTSKSATAIITVVKSGFRPTGSMAGPHIFHTATLLPNGTVIIVGSCDEDPSAGGCFPSGAPDLYDPAHGTFSTASGDLGIPRFSHTATRLQNGKVLFAGGETAGPDTPTAELYDPATGSFTPTGSMTTGRASHTATLLPDGKVLVAGGSCFSPITGFSCITDAAELYDPATGSFTSTGSMGSRRSAHIATLLSNGTVLITGGFGDPISSTSVATAEVYDPATGSFTSTGSMGSPRAGHSATLLSSGTVLIAGGFDGSAAAMTAEIYNPATGLFTPTGSMGSPRSAHIATLLSNGTVLVAGGFAGSGSLTTAEVYDPATGLFTSTGSMGSPRTGHTATLLLNGQVLIAGGFSEDIDIPLSSAELFVPASSALTVTGSITEK